MDRPNNKKRFFVSKTNLEKKIANIILVKPTRILFLIILLISKFSFDPKRMFLMFAENPCVKIYIKLIKTNPSLESSRCPKKDNTNNIKILVKKLEIVKN